MRRRLGWVPPILLLLLMLMGPTPAAAATDSAGPLILTGPDDPAFVHGGDRVQIPFRITAFQATQSHHLTASVSPGDGGNWGLTVEPSQVVLPAGGDRTFVVTVEAARLPSPREVAFEFRVHAVGQDFQAATLHVNATVQSTGTDYILGHWPNPLPAPLDNPLGAFLLNLAAWLLISFSVLWLVRPFLLLLTKRTKTDLDHLFVAIIGHPAFVLLFTFGIKQSLEVFALPIWFFAALERIWLVLLSAMIVYVLYRTWREIILTFGRRLATRTKSEVDDKLLPVFEKLGSVAIVVVGIWIIVAGFGVNMTLFAAGGAVAGLVIAFAAQDTLGNFFSGIFILLDRPFRVGDRIELPQQQTWGDVREVGLRTTRILTRDNRMVIMPNSVIAGNPIVNHSYPDTQYRIQTEFEVEYGAGVEVTRMTLVDTVRGLPGVLPDKPVEALLLGFEANGLLWRTRWWIDSYTDTRRVLDRVHSAVLRALEENGIRIAYPQRTLWYGREEIERRTALGDEARRATGDERKELVEAAEKQRAKLEREERAEVDEARRKARERERTGRREERRGEADDGAPRPGGEDAAAG